MNTQEKLEYIVDRLLVKTQDNFCEWKYGTDKKYSLCLHSGYIYLYWNQIIGGSDTIILDVVNHHNKDVILSSLKVKKEDENTNLVRLYNSVTKYYQNYVDTYVEKLLKDIQELEKNPLPI